MEAERAPAYPLTVVGQALEGLTCPSCGHPNRSGRRFCAECGGSLAVLCAACGVANEPGERFCGDCGSPLDPKAVATREVPTAGVGIERRLVSVLFADLVGHTALAEQRDVEDVRELLSRYFELAQTLVERYGGEIEKFIGDAVMAVWGTPTAREDDAERAVRAALELVSEVASLGTGDGAPALAARAAVLTGEAAVALEARGQGMVAGDLVNTASRVQAIAKPGTVLVGAATRRATEASIAYADAGEHELKGKAEPVPLWQALRVTAGRGGGLKSNTLDPPFVGRDRELHLLKELFHANAEERKAHLVSLVGIAGIGKSRLAWELQKYLDGVAQTVYWHRGRCLADGEGVSYWALAEMVRMRAEIAEGEEPESARAKLRQRSSVTSPIPTSGTGSSRGSPSCFRWTVTRPASDPTCSQAGGSSSSASPSTGPSSSPSRTCSGRTRLCSSFSSISSTGRATIHSS